MCIRDRLWIRLAARFFDHHAGERAEHVLVAGPVARDGVGAVSYTHLRAHETVLDLVCRLLLEKKCRKHRGIGYSLVGT